jgi:hypothetical protein
MPPSGDELAGIVDLFGALTREQLRRAVREAAFRAGEDVDDAAVDAAITSAVAEYRLVGYDPEGGDGEADADPASAGEDGLLVVGPTAFPEPPAGSEDLPHIMDVDRRDADRDAAGEAVARRFRAETARAVERGDEHRIERLLDVSYDLETWAPVEMGPLRDRLDEALGE